MQSKLIPQSDERAILLTLSKLEWSNGSKRPAASTLDEIEFFGFI
jgi:hypothetical protein